MHSLEKLLSKILARIKIDLILGSANKKIDLERTSSWSGEAVDHTRTIATYEKNALKYEARFFKLRVSSAKNMLPYVVDGANAQFSRAGNCQEHVGLALYYLFHHPELWRKVEVVTLDDCFDHIFLRISTPDKKVFFFDSWAELIFEQATKENLDKMTQVIMSGLHAIIEQPDASDDVKEIGATIAQCNKILQAGTLTIAKEFSYTPKKAKQFIQQFDEYYDSLLKPSPQPPAPPQVS
jgi:hypothetical protein